MLSTRLNTFLLFLSFCISGCTSWSLPTEDLPNLPTPRMSSDSVVLDIYFVRFPAEDSQFLDKLWNEVDEQFLPMERQKKLSINGFRYGLVGTVLPKQLSRIMNVEKGNFVTEESINSNSKSDSNGVSLRRRRQIRTGKRFEILASKLQEKIIALTYKNDLLRGHEFYQAQCLFAVKAYPLEDGRVRFRLKPEIRHGQSRNLITSEVNQSSFVMKSGQEQKTFEQLNLEAVLSSGQSLLLTCSSEFKGLGKEFFIEEIDGALIQKLILIRLSQTQHSDLTTSE